MSDIKTEQAANRKQIQDFYAAERQAEIEELQSYNKMFPCDFCRDLEKGNGNGTQYGLVFNGHTIKCPECDKCFWSRES